MENELMHYRTRGSRNGVRRYQTRDGTWTPLGLERRRTGGISRNIKRTILGIFGISKESEFPEMYGISKASDEAKTDIMKAKSRREVSEFDDAKFLDQDVNQDIVIKKGSEAYRVQAGKNLRSSGHAYVSMTPEGHAIYVDYAGNGDGGLDASNSTERPYSIRMSLKKDLVIPAMNTKIDAFISTVSKLGVKEVANDISEQHDKKIVKDFIKGTKDKSTREAKDIAYLAFCSSLCYSPTLRNEFFSDLKRRGYNAIIDENDQVGNDRNAYKTNARTMNDTGFDAVMVFDANDTLTVKKTTRIDTSLADIATIAVDDGNYDQFKKAIGITGKRKE